MEAEDKKLLYAEETYKVRRALFNVYNVLGFGHKELVYQKALEKELDDLEVVYKREVDLGVCYKGETVGHYRPDFLINDTIILEIKAVEFMPKSFEQQLLHYLKSTEIKVGLLVNFGAPRLVIKRFVWSSAKIRPKSA